MAILVTGGAGYIGSHTVAELLGKKEEVVVVDNLTAGHAASVSGGTFYQGDLRDRGFLDTVFKRHEIEAVIHFAASSLVGESVARPLDYYENNMVASHTLVSAMVANGVNKIVFSSTAAIFGEPESSPIHENHSTNPMNPYGETKLGIEKMLRWCDNAYGLKSISLRYFNAAGAHLSGSIGEDHEPESHLIPLILKVALGQKESISIFGTDYPTKDGTCIRDYIHVKDLAEAHLLSLEHLRLNGRSDAFNLGNGIGYSVKEVIEMARKITGHPIPAEVAARRTGDPAVLIASSEKAKKNLDWKPRHSDLETMISTAWSWHKSHPRGFNDKE